MPTHTIQFPEGHKCGTHPSFQAFCNNFCLLTPRDCPEGHKCVALTDSQTLATASTNDTILLNVSSVLNSPYIALLSGRSVPWQKLVHQLTLGPQFHLQSHLVGKREDAAKMPNNLAVPNTPRGQSGSLSPSSPDQTSSFQHPNTSDTNSEQTAIHDRDTIPGGPASTKPKGAIDNLIDDYMTGSRYSLASAMATSRQSLSSPSCCRVT